MEWLWSALQFFAVLNMANSPNYLPAESTARAPEIAVHAAARESCSRAGQSSSRTGWTHAETWAWKRLCHEEHVTADDWATHLEAIGSPASGELRIRGAFISAILTRPEFRNKLPQKGVHISGVTIADSIDLSEQTIQHPLEILASTITGDVLMPGLTSKSTIEFRATTITGKLNLTAAKLERSLVVSKYFVDRETGDRSDAGNASVDQLVAINLSVDHDVDLHGLRVKNRFDLSGSQIGGDLDVSELVAESFATFESAHIAADMYVNGTTVSERLDLSSVQISGDLEIRRHRNKGSTIRDISAKRLDVGGTVEFDSLTLTFDADLVNASIGRAFFIDSSKFGGVLELSAVRIGDRFVIGTDETKHSSFYAIRGNHLDVGSFVSIGNAEVQTEISLQELRVDEYVIIKNIHSSHETNSRTNGAALYLDYAIIKDELIIVDGIFSKINLEGAYIDGSTEFSMNNESTIIWSDNATVTFFDARLADIKGSTKIFEGSLRPENINTAGLTYKKIDFVDIDVDSIMPADAEWYIKYWVDTGRDDVSSRSYEQLAAAVEASGHDRTASQIRFLGYDQQRSNRFCRSDWILAEIDTWEYGNFLSCPFSWILGASTGYGEQPLRLVVLGLFTILVGIFVRWHYERWARRSFIQSAFFSLDRFIPAIQLRDSNYKNQMRQGHEWYFIVHALVGYFIAFFGASSLALREWLF